MGWWWNLTVEWPGMLGDWLWKLLVQMPLATLKELTLRRILTVLALTILVAMFAQAAIPGDIALLLAGDTMAYYEAAIVLWLLATKGHAREIARMMMNLARVAVRFVAGFVSPGAVRRGELRGRARGHMRRVRRLGRSRNEKEEPGARIPAAAYRRPRRGGRYFGPSASGVWAFSPRLSSSAHASSAVLTKLNSARSAWSITPLSTSASKLTMRRQ